MDLEQVRNEIDKIDSEIRKLLASRMSLIPIVAKIKIEKGIKMHQPRREEEIYNRIREFAKEAKIDEELLVEIYRLIIKKSLEIECEYERRMKNEL